MSSPYPGTSPVGSPDVGPMTTPITPVPPASSTATATRTEVTENYVSETGRPDVEGVSVGQLIGEVTKDLSTLMRQELDLAKAEMKVEAKKAGQGAGAFGAAGFAGYMVLMFLSFALWWALENVMDAGLAALIVAILWGVIGAVAYTVGRSKFREVHPKPERTVDTLSQVPSALKPN